jgi:hypothetical protein
MKQTVNSSIFHDAFINLRPDNFSYEAREMLFEYFESIEGSGDEEIELDVIAICCDYSEDTLEGVISNYSIDLDGLDSEEDEAEVLGQVTDYLENHTSLIGVTSDNTFVYVNF